MDSKLYWAAFNGQIEIFKERVKELDLTELLTLLEKNTVVHVNIISSKTSDESFTKEILEMCPRLLLQTNARGETPLLMAARYGHESIVEFLINLAKRDDLEKANAGGGDNEEVDKKMMMRMKNAENDTALHEAVRFGHLEIVRIWIREDPHFSYYSANEAGETPLYLAIQAGYTKVAHEILDSCTSPHTGGPNGRTILHAAIYDIDLMRKILEKVECLTKQVDVKGCTPLHLAAAFLFGYKSVGMLLDKDESCAYIRNKNGKTALHIAAQQNSMWYLKVIKEIMLRCPNGCEIVDNQGRNVLHYAVRRKDLSMVEEILKHCSESNELLNGKDIDGNTPMLLMGATSSWHPEILDALLSHPRVNKMAFNKQNINIPGMVDAYIYNDLDDNDEDRKVKKELRQLVWKYPITKKLYIQKLNFDEHEEEINLLKEKMKAARKAEMERKRSSFITKYTESTLVTATLIATVTFTAGFTLPGGFFGHEVGYPQQGSAILKKNTAFQAFIITNTIAMVLSTTSVFMNLFLTIINFDEIHYQKLKSYFVTCMLLAMAAMGFMVIAFVTGVYAVLSLSFWLAIANCLIGLSFFIFLFFTIVRTRPLIRSFRYFLKYDEHWETHLPVLPIFGL